MFRRILISLTVGLFLVGAAGCPSTNSQVKKTDTTAGDSATPAPSNGAGDQTPPSGNDDLLQGC